MAKLPFESDNNYLEIINLLNEVKENDQIEFKKSVLPRLVINISNDCNLRCKYCYAAGGSYNGTREIMSIETLHRTLDMFYKTFAKIENIQLFGGEPTMNIPAIKYTCEYVKRNSYETSVGFVTNGTIMSEELFELIKSYNIQVTVSIDIDSIHDLVRPYTSGKGSLTAIQANLEKLKLLNQPKEFEVTYTRLHVDMGYSIYQVVRELSSQYGIYNIHLAPVCTSHEEYRLANMDDFVSSVDDFFLNVDKGTAPYALMQNILFTLKTKLKNQYFCFAGFGTIAVSVTGKVYPCFYFYEKKEFEYCSVFDEEGAFSRAIGCMQDKYMAYNRSENPKCKNCFAMTVCRGCLGSNYSQSGNEYDPPDSICEMTRGMLEHILTNLAKCSIQ